MLKYLILLFNMVFLLVLKTVNNERVTITPSFPAEVKAGSEFVMEMTINRANVEGFAKFQQDLPKGFSAKEIESEGASFTFSGQSVKLIWSSLPSETEFKVSYKISVREDVSGEQSLGGKFAYVIDNVKQTVDLPAAAIKVMVPKTEAAAEDNPVKDDAHKPQSVVVAGNSIPASVSLSRKIFPTANPAEFMVEVTANKGNIAGFAKLQENIPDGYTAVPANTGSSSFTFIDQKVKFVWLIVPPEESFTVSYLIKADTAAKGDASVDGIFSYIENDETKKYILGSTGFTNPPPSEPVSGKRNETPADTAKKQNTGTQASADTTKPVTEVTNIPSPEANIVYKVQIAALHKAVDVSYFKQKNNIAGKINTELHEGWTKYTVGSFREYRPARDHREDIRAKKIQGPFVTAYNTGKRITVQEALMITSQKWYK